MKRRITLLLLALSIALLAAGTIASTASAGFSDGNAQTTGFSDGN